MDPLSTNPFQIKDDVHVKQNGHTRLFFTGEEVEEDLVEYTAAKSAGVPWDGISRLTKEKCLKGMVPHTLASASLREVFGAKQAQSRTPP
jgi:hypothetical protein